MTPPARTRTCARCRTTAPSTETDYTLIGSKHGWRCRKVDSGGATRLEWYCDACWKGVRVVPDSTK
jgi:hypothetical protein